MVNTTLQLRIRAKSLTYIRMSLRDKNSNIFATESVSWRCGSHLIPTILERRWFSGWLWSVSLLQGTMNMLNIMSILFYSLTLCCHFRCSPFKTGYLTFPLCYIDSAVKYKKCTEEKCTKDAWLWKSLVLYLVLCNWRCSLLMLCGKTQKQHDVLQPGYNRVPAATEKKKHNITISLNVFSMLEAQTRKCPLTKGKVLLWRVTCCEPHLTRLPSVLSFLPLRH